MTQAINQPYKPVYSKPEKITTMEKKDAVKEFLEKILPDIELIDGGCFECVGNFCYSVNTKLAGYGLRLNDDDIRDIKIEDLPPTN